MGLHELRMPIRRVERPSRLPSRDFFAAALMRTCLSECFKHIVIECRTDRREWQITGGLHHNKIVESGESPHSRFRLRCLKHGEKTAWTDSVFLNGGRYIAGAAVANGSGMPHYIDSETPS